MGFWSTVGNGLKTMVKEAERNRAYEEDLYNRYQNYDSQTLRSRARGEGFTDIHEARQAARVLNERGENWTQYGKRL